MNFAYYQAIKKTLAFGSTPVDKTSILNIAYGVDKNFMFGAAISITSVLLNNKDVAIHFHLFTDYLDTDFQQRVEMLVQQFSAHVTLYIMNADELKDLPYGNAWSYATYFRFIAFEYLSEKIAALLYIDADVICKGSLNKLCDIQFGNSVAAVVQDVEDSRRYAATRLEIPEFDQEYFNAGVIYANLVEWRKQDFLNTAFAMLMDKDKHFAFLDQDVLNVMFLNKVIFLPRTYDVIYGMKQELKSKDTSKYKFFITDDTILIHYIGVTKPWHNWARYPSAQYFTTAYNASPWSDVPLLKAITPKQFKKQSRHERLQRKYILSVKSYISYLLAKLRGLVLTFLRKWLL